MTEKAAWHDAYPQPRNTDPGVLKREELLEWFKAGRKPGVDYLLVDLRRTDHEGGTIRGSINLPAQSLYNSLSTVLNLCRSAGVQIVIWYCGSSRGRGTRAAGWFDDRLRQGNVTGIGSVILEGGITGWADAGEEYTQWMDGYDPEHWQKK